MQNISGLVWLFIPLIFVILVALLMMRPRNDSKKGFYFIIIVGSIFVVGYYIIRIFIFPP